MNIFNLFAKLSLDKSDYEKGLKETSSLNKKETEQIKSRLNDIRNSTKTVMGDLARAFANGTSKFEDFSYLLNESQSSLNETSRVAKQLGIDIEDVGENSDDTGNKISKSLGVIALNAVVSLSKEVVNLGRKFVNLVTDTIDFADSYSDLSAQYDISTRSLQKFDYIATQNSTTLDNLLSAMTQTYNRAKEDNSVFNELGVSVRDDNGNMKTMDTLFWEVQYALDKVTNSGNKGAYMLSIYGRNANSVGGVLRSNSADLEELAERAETIGIILDEKTIQSADNFNNLLAEMKMRGKAVFANFIAGADGSKEAMANYMQDLVDIISAFIPAFAVLGLKLGWELLKGFVRGVGKVIWGFISGDKFTFEDALNDAFETAHKEIQTITQRTETSYDNSTLNSSNDVYNMTINFGNANYSEDDARELAQQIIKEIATQKQAGGR